MRMKGGTCSLKVFSALILADFHGTRIADILREPQSVTSWMGNLESVCATTAPHRFVVYYPE